MDPNMKCRRSFKSHLRGQIYKEIVAAHLELRTDTRHAGGNNGGITYIGKTFGRWHWLPLPSKVWGPRLRAFPIPHRILAVRLELELSHHKRSTELGRSTELKLSHHGRSMELGRSKELGIVSSSLNDLMDLPNSHGPTYWIESRMVSILWAQTFAYGYQNKVFF